MAGAERTQKDTQDLEGNRIRLVFEKYEEEGPRGTDEKGIYSCIHYYIGPNIFTMVFVNARSAQDAYAALKNVRSFSVEVQSQTRVTEEKG